MSPSDTDALLARVQQIAADTFRCDREQIQTATTAADIDGWDSLSHTLFVIELERAFGVRFDLPRIACATSVGDLVGEIARLLA